MLSANSRACSPSCERLLQKNCIRPDRKIFKCLILEDISEI
ncbi:hypothetical protein L21SP2_2472 [Salinispira pacifica]|uniref:Uncharacterized protein n=1 Tax=Salinispira pacifica TaxID=1307761 RepID=V5WJK9_9SPIO|nr:hypothetical protein L21SP2_2472 [Salinispira pacifica]